MKVITVKELEDLNLKYIGEKPDIYYKAIIAVAKDGTHLAYSFEKIESIVRKRTGKEYPVTNMYVKQLEADYCGKDAGSPEILRNNFVKPSNAVYNPLRIISNEK